MKKAPKADFVRLQATDLEVLIPGVVFSTKKSLSSPIKTDFYLNDTGPVHGYMISILLEENLKCLRVLWLHPSFS